MKHIQKILFTTFILLTIQSCSPKKDTILSRNYNAMKTYFNILFNGEVAFEQGLQGIRDSYKDDWFQQLVIEPIEFDDRKIALPTFRNNSPGAGFGNTAEDETPKKESTSFDRAEEKAVKAIQLHGMNINGLERNSQIDNAYLLLGKSRYYSQRFIPAIEAFNYVIANYPNADLIAETKIWRAKANIRMNNEEFAIESMNLLLKVKDTLEKKFPDVINEKGHTALAMAYMQADSLQKVKKHLKLATKTQKNIPQAARNLFVLGQIYAQEQQKDSAAMVFNRLSNFKKAPYKYKIHAVIELAKNASTDSISAVVLERLRSLIKKRENRPYLDELYYQVAKIHENYDSIQLAKSFYNNSLRAKNASEKQKSYTYESLGNLYFKEAAYTAASSYYDSVLTVSKDTLELRIRRVKRKFKNLASLIRFEALVKTNDSIIRIASLPKEAQETFFKDYIDNLKKRDEEAAQLRLNQLAFGATTNSLQSTSKGKWYFYNNQTLSFGRAEFAKIWGQRALQDNWRWSASATLSSSKQDSILATAKDTRYELATYLDKIPAEKSVIDSLITSRNQALYELGLIYKEQFKNLSLATSRLERVEKLNPAKALVLPINWHLFQIYSTQDIQKSLVYKNKILNDFPETIFAKIIQNPNTKIAEETAITETQQHYKELYYLYKKGDYSEVLVAVNTILESLTNSKLKPKFELLKAYAIGKHLDKKTYKEALEFVAINYGNTTEGKKAKEIIIKLDK